MDALPQRPFRTIKVRDENVPLTSGAALKTIHQRNKSSPALYTLANNGAQKPMAKRTAFADVSNVVRQPQIRDDSAIINKPTIEVMKETRIPEPLKPITLNRPAQRPLSVAGIKGFLNNFTSHSTSNNIKLLPAVEERQEAVAQVAAPKPLARALSQRVLPVKQLPPLAPAVELPEPRYRELQPMRPTDDLKNAGFNFGVKRENNRALYEPLPAPLPAPLPLPYDVASVAYTDVRSDGVHLYSADPLESIYPGPQHHFEASEIYVDAPSHCHPESRPEPLRFKDVEHVAQLPDKQLEMVQLLPLSEVEEYWDEDGYDEEYDDGYTTTRSLKSKGDYTTGATTVVMAPRQTARVEREIAAAKQTVLSAKVTEDVEDDESWDTSMVAEYSDEIFDYMRVLEERMRPNPYYMDSQTEVQWSMRSVLMDWLVQVHHRFNLLPETLFLCVNYIDRFLSCKVVSLGKLQLVGATAIFVAAKYEEINCPSVSEIVYMVDNGYTVDEILKAERFMLSMLQFELGWPGPMSFLRRISKADDYDLETRTLAKYFLEITIMDERFVGCIPSYTAAGAHCLSRLMLKKGTWSPAHVYYSNYTYAQLRPLLIAMVSCCENPQKHHAAIFDKYSDHRFKKASHFVNQELMRGFVLPLMPRLSIPMYELNAKYKC